MKSAEIVLSFVKVLVWPVVVVTLAGVFRAQLRHVLDRVTRVETPAGSLELALTAEAVVEQAAEVAADLSREPRTPDTQAPPRQRDPHRAPGQGTGQGTSQGTTGYGGAADVGEPHPGEADAPRGPDRPRTVATLATARRRMREALWAQERGDARAAMRQAWRAVQLTVSAGDGGLAHARDMPVRAGADALRRAGCSPQVVDLYSHLYRLHQRLRLEAGPRDDLAVDMFVSSCEIFLTTLGVPPVRRSTVPVGDAPE